MKTENLSPVATEVFSLISASSTGITARDLRMRGESMGIEHAAPAARELYQAGLIRFDEGTDRRLGRFKARPETFE